ncbi:DUF4184 family protein [Hymenobacter busanensis]|uniref:DUF4184 family protein n=1 Tax=Hymenobacter busanensis TaxID=2607656 RepID=UPI001366A5BE|nr:DUF4184 family protein [Hymenobacter busanensis]QHJ06197.1 DUF4184 family protein [Hymenobacter busanensis]
MPFTFCHPAAVLPLRQLLPRLPLSALVVGSMSPDFIYFLRLVPDGDIGHTLAGLFTFCLPTSLAVLWLWHRVVKEAAAAVLPAPLRVRLWPPARQPFAFGPASRFLGIGGAILVGALTHIVWDGFTHADGWAVRHLPLLQGAVPFLGFGSMPISKLAQHLSSLAGGLLLLWWFRKWLRTAPVAAPQASRITEVSSLVWPLLLVSAAAAAGFGYGYWRTQPIVDYLSARGLLARGIVSSCTALWLELVVLGLWRRAAQLGAAAE